MKFSFHEILSRLTGISTPVFGISWNPPATDVQVARRILIFLEDRRVLFNLGEQEDRDYSIQSVVEIRKHLTEELEQLDSSSPLADSIRAMRRACRKFLDQVIKHRANELFVYEGIGITQDTVFYSAIRELRGIFGIHLAQLVVKYGLEVEPQLTTIFPNGPSLDED